jgi:putative CocE/NonD family hydrolase
MGSFMVSQTGRSVRYDQDNTRLQRDALTYTSDAFDTEQLLAGPVGLTIFATADRSETLWVAHLDDVSPEGVSRPLTQGALLGSHRALDPESSWVLPDGTILRPQHISTRQAAAPVVPGELTRYDIEVFPTAALLAPGHRLRLTVTTYDFPHLVPTRPQRTALTGGTYRISQGGVHASHLVVPLADPATMEQL